MRPPTNPGEGKRRRWLWAFSVVLAIVLCIAVESAACSADGDSDAAAEPNASPGGERPAAKRVRRRRNLVPNGSFQKGKLAPEGWQQPDNLTTFWAVRPGGERGDKCIMVDTDVYEAEVKEWHERRKRNPNARPPKKTPPTGEKYNTIAGTYGVPFWSDEIPVRKGAAYRISADVKGTSKGDSFPKVFVKGFADIKGRPRKVYEFYLACRNTTGEWQSYTSRPFHPSRTIGRNPTADRMKVMLYAYWPPGAYYFDNIRIEEVYDDEQE